MKKSIILLSAALFAAASAFADGRSVPASKLPHMVRGFVSEHFAGNGIVSATADDNVIGTSYDVVLENGTEIEFSRSGEWSEIKSGKGGAVPTGVVPSKIASYVSKRYPAARIVKIERGRRDWEVDLSNGAELTFDKNFKVIGFDEN